MSFSIGELFIKLGIDGSDKTVGALSNVKKGLGEVASMSLEAKAGILAALYGLERLTAQSGAAGTGLTNFNAITGLSMKQLQQYQYAARQAGASNAEMEGTFKSLQTSMTKTLLHGQAPAGLARVSQLTGNITKEEVEQFARNPALLLQRLQDYAQKEKSIALKRETLSTFGIGDNVQAGLDRQVFTPENMAKAPTYSNQEIGALDKANIAWSNLGNKIEMAVGHFNAMHGGQLVKDISGLIDPTLKLAGAFTVLAEKMKVFSALSGLIKGLSGAMGDISQWLSPEKGKAKRSFWGDELDDKGKAKTGVPLLEGGMGNLLHAVLGGNTKKGYSEQKAIQAADKVKPIWEYFKPHEPAIAHGGASVAPRMGASSKTGGTHNTTLTQTNHFHGKVDEPKAAARALKKQVGDVIKQSPAQGRAT